MLVGVCTCMGSGKIKAKVRFVWEQEEKKLVVGSRWFVKRPRRGFPGLPIKLFS